MLCYLTTSIEGSKIGLKLEHYVLVNRMMFLVIVSEFRLHCHHGRLINYENDGDKTISKERYATASLYYVESYFDHSVCRLKKKNTDCYSQNSQAGT